jgi:predicted Zn-dependent protease
LRDILSIRTTLGAILLMTVVGCTTAPVTGRKQFNWYSEGQEAQMGIASFSAFKTQYTINDDPQLNLLVQRVGARIAAATGNDLPNAQWEFVVFENEQPNAFCLPGGKVGIFTGILPITKDEAGLATVIGHEVAHAAARHGGERMTTAQVLGMGQIAVDVATQNESSEERMLWNSLYGTTATLGAALPHSRLQETEADRIGLMYMARAGYDPEEAIAFWSRFAEFNQQQGDVAVWFLRTHPLDQTRIEDIRSWLPEAKRQYQPQP